MILAILMPAAKGDLVLKIQQMSMKNENFEKEAHKNQEGSFRGWHFFCEKGHKFAGQIR